MPKDLKLKAALAAWLAGQSRYKDLREAAAAIGMPFNTLRGYFSGKRPSGKNLKLLIGATGMELDLSLESSKLKVPNRKSRMYATRLLEELQCDLAGYIVSISEVQKFLNDGVPKKKLSTSARIGRRIQNLMDALQRDLDAVVTDPQALEWVRRTVSGSDAGYLSGLLGSLFDDRRLQTWLQLTTYKYGSK